MEFETICTISMSCLAAQVLGQIDNLDGFIWAAFNAHTATNAECLRNESNRRRFFNIDTNFTDFVSGTCFLAFKGTLFRFALIRVDNGDSEL
jgi:hypothetical protein